jgi:hypothetical protein
VDFYFTRLRENFVADHKKRIFSGIAVIAMVLLTGLYSCKKTESPLGFYAPNGLDRPTYTPTPQTGAIEVYIKDTGSAVPSVNIYLLDPSGNTFTSQTTQPGVGYAAFNPPSLTSGVWTAEVPTQSVSYGIYLPGTGVTQTIKHTYGYSTLPITVAGSGQYAATFTTGGNNVQVSPITQAYGTGIPVNIPATVTYYENGNLDVPVSVSMVSNPSLTGLNFLSPASWIFGGVNLIATDTLGKNICYSQPITLSLTANDFSGNPVSISNATVSKNYSVGVTLYATKIANGATQFVRIMVDTTNDCGATIWNTTESGSGDSGSGTIASGQMISMTTDTQPFIVSASTTSVYGTVSGSFQVADIPFTTWTQIGSGSF